ncbi:ABC transporter permease [Clostridium ganghwense]|uniref:ABC transporter permease n=1 Tax=Clostridium ganghwense TaxID=312089 RepID=A0ABT4CJ39_9CLOT|nr:ABC transporter permease [Clostridium ganghwense]MCY6369066.1 ABC transporter permease [Clostridium ganghwense]
MEGFLLSVLEQGLIFAIVSLGVYITYKILDFPDLSVDGTFPLGAAVTALCLSKGINPLVACLFSIFAGMIGGLITGMLHVKLKITNLLSGILVMIALYSVNLRIMGKSNISFFKFNTIFTSAKFINSVILIALFAVGVKLLLDLFLKTKMGFMLKAVGDNEQLVTSLGVNKDTIKIIGLMISNGIVALGGSIMAQHQGYAAVGMGTGTVVIGLAAVILGEAVLKRLKFVRATTMALLGAVLYKLAIGASLRMGLPPSDLKLITAVIVIAVLGTNNLSFSFKGRKKEEREVNTIATSKKSIQGIQ